MATYDDTYLVFKHFPNSFSEEDKVDFLKYFGAIDVKCLPSKSKKGNVCFARFPSKDLAKEIIIKLHQVDIMGQLLSVEYVRGSDLNYNVPSYVESISGKEEKGDSNKYYEQFLTRLNSWTNVVDFQRPPPVHLRYCYPAPTLASLTNIVRAVYSVPKLYTQLLHLMNKMNLPCPFDDDFPIDCNIYVTDSIKQYTELSEGESELEEDTTTTKEILPSGIFTRKRKRTLKRPKLIIPANVNTDSSKVSIPTSEIFEAPPKDINLKKIEVKVSADLSSITKSKQETADIIQEPFAPLEVYEEPSTEVIAESEETYKGKVISEEELNSNRISAKDRRMLPVFKNYQAGTPSCRLYIKNLAKNVAADDLHFIYRRYYEEKEEEQGIMYDIRVMQEGRMKGQAFVTLQTVPQARQALDETNGFVLKGKPMVVQFARSSKRKPEAETETDQ